MYSVKARPNEYVNLLSSLGISVTTLSGVTVRFILAYFNSRENTGIVKFDFIYLLRIMSTLPPMYDMSVSN